MGVFRRPWRRRKTNVRDRWIGTVIPAPVTVPTYVRSAGAWVPTNSTVRVSGVFYNTVDQKYP